MRIGFISKHIQIPVFLCDAVKVWNDKYQGILKKCALANSGSSHLGFSTLSGTNPQI